MKTCKTCRELKPLSAFHQEPRVKDGHTAVCKLCAKVRDALWQKSNRQRYNSYQHQWRVEHPARALEIGRTWRRKHPERSRAFTRAWQAAHPERRKENRRRWAAENRARISLYAQERRAREQGATGATTPKQLEARIEYYGRLCYLCHKPYQAIDHVIPLAKGGTNWPANLRPICTPCNSKKGTKRLSELRPIIQAASCAQASLP